MPSPKTRKTENFISTWNLATSHQTKQLSAADHKIKLITTFILTNTCLNFTMSMNNTSIYPDLQQI